MVICEHCLEAIKSRGEKVIIKDDFYIEEEDGIICEWCEEEIDGKAYEIGFMD